MLARAADALESAATTLRPADAKQTKQHFGASAHRSVWADAAGDASGKPVKPEYNRALVFTGDRKVEIQKLPYPLMQMPTGELVEHGVILKVVASAICGTDLHAFRDHLPKSKGVRPGHEITGEVIEMGGDVELFNLGDIVSVPFNVSGGRCSNCRHAKANACLHVHGDLGVGAMYGMPSVGDFSGGQAEYHFVPYADFQLLALPKDRALSKLTAGLAFLTDVFCTGFHGAVTAGVGAGSIVYVAGAGPVGLCAAQSCMLLGAAQVFISDLKESRLKLAERIGCKTIDLTKIKGGSLDATHIKEVILSMLPPEKNFGHDLVDASIDCVGYEASGVGGDSSSRVGEQSLNTCIQLTKAGGKIGVPGFYPLVDKSASGGPAKGVFSLQLGLAWQKGIEICGLGQCPVNQYNEQLMKAVLYGRVDLAPLLNVRIISLDEAPAAYTAFEKGEAAKFLIDPHGSLPKQQ